MAKKKPGSQTVFWWVAWITLTIASFFVASWFWTPIIARNFGSVRETKVAVIWISAVFGTWILMLLPLIIVMYQKVDKAYEDARISREKAANRFRSILVDVSKRTLAPNVAAKLKGVPDTIEGGHLVTAILKDGRRIPNVFISERREVLGIYDYSELPFEGKDVTDLEPADSLKLPVFFQNQWLRLDGVKAPE